MTYSTCCGFRWGLFALCFFVVEKVWNTYGIRHRLFSQPIPDLFMLPPGGRQYHNSQPVEVGNRWTSEKVPCALPGWFILDPESDRACHTDHLGSILRPSWNE